MLSGPGVSLRSQSTEVRCHGEDQGGGTLEGLSVPGGTTHFEDEDGLLYVTMQAYVSKSPMGPVILVSRVPIMKKGLVSKRYDDTPVHAANVIRMIGAVLEEAGASWRGFSTGGR